MSAPDAVLFDLDGTLTDPKPGICGSIAYAMDKLGHVAPSHDDLDWCIGPPLLGSFARLLATQDPAVLSAAVAYYRERFSAGGLFENRVYDGIPECLSTLQKHGIPLFVATSKPKVFADQIVERFGLADYFRFIYGSELDGTRCDKGEVIGHALASEGLAGKSLLMIGDRKHDVIGARKWAIPCIGVTYGYGSAEELTSAGAFSLCDSPEELIDAILNSA